MRHPLHSTRVRIRAPRYGGATASMESLHQHQGQKHYEGYKLLKDVLHRPRQRSLDELRKIKYEEFLEEPLIHIIHLQTYEKDAWTIFELMELQDALTDSQLLIVEVKPNDHSCYFLFVGPPATHSLWLLKAGDHFHGIKDPLLFFDNHCHFHCCC